ncbi:unnamed protein product [Mesocestoides corti]|uniref:Uncharacterized protein n=2 Tax=Mesocestoides corti TaxID=53468 RepID=A0A0R3U5L1_MESCO|nr:unnamed protein product [Mesocestoides corti]
MGLNISETEDAIQAAFLLPAPLFIIYSKLTTFVDVKDLKARMNVRIVGDLELARSINATTASNFEDFDADSSESGDQEGPGGKRKCRRKSKHATIGEEERPQPRTDSPHPLSVVVCVTSRPDERWPNLHLTLTFVWLMRAKLVTVKEEVQELEKLYALSQTGRDLLSSEKLLINLNCTGASCEGGEPAFLTSGGDRTQLTAWGRPYGWAQQLSGVQCLPCVDSACGYAAPASPSSSSSSSPAPPFGFIDSWFSALCRRVETRMSLNSELCAIEDGVLHLSENQKPFFPISEDIGLSTWDRVTFDDIKVGPVGLAPGSLIKVEPSSTVQK